MCSCEHLKQENEAKVGENGETKDGHDPRHENVAEDVCTHEESHSYKDGGRGGKRERERERDHMTLVIMSRDITHMKL